MKLIEANKDKLIQLCNEHNVAQLYLFGSILTDKFNESSDVDMLIRFYQVDLANYFDNYMGLKEKLEDLFHRSVDLVEDQAIKNPVFRGVVDREKKLIYERKNS